MKEKKDVKDPKIFKLKIESPPFGETFKETGGVI